MLVRQADFTPEWVRQTLLPLLLDRNRIDQMTAAMAGLGKRDGARVLADWAREAGGV